MPMLHMVKPKTKTAPSLSFHANFNSLKTEMHPLAGNSLGKSYQTASGMVSIFPKSFRSSILLHLDLFNFVFRVEWTGLQNLHHPG